MSDIDDDDVDDGADEWLYVEDAWDEADELAEQTCPSPPLQTIVPDEDVDPYDYFVDLDYLSDGYYDARADSYVRRRGKRKLQERKRQAKVGDQKRRRTGSSLKSNYVRGQDHQHEPPVSWVPRHDRNFGAGADAPLINPSELPIFTLFRNWGQRFRGTKGVDVHTSSEIDMRRHTEEVNGQKEEPKYRHSEAGDEATEHPEGTREASDILDLGDLKNIAELLTEENMGQLTAILKAKGIDPEALETVLGDLVEGRELEFNEDEDLEDDEEVSSESAPTIASESKQCAETADSKDQRRLPQDDRNGTAPNMHGEQQTQPSHKRKARLMQFDGSDNDEDVESNGPDSVPPSKRGRIQVDAPSNESASRVGTKRKGNNASSTSNLKRTKVNHAAGETGASSRESARSANSSRT